MAQKKIFERQSRYVLSDPEKRFDALPIEESRSLTNGPQTRGT
jgi:hypothetical protein